VEDKLKSNNADQSKERKNREDVDKARVNLRDKERKLVDGAPEQEEQRLP